MENRHEESGAWELVSLDGVMERPEEWAFSYSDDEMGSGSGASSEQQGGGVGLEAARKALAELEGKVLSTGPYGEKSTPASKIELGDEDLKQIKATNATAAISRHYGGNDWAKADYYQHLSFPHLSPQFSERRYYYFLTAVILFS